MRVHTCTVHTYTHTIHRPNASKLLKHNKMMRCVYLIFYILFRSEVAKINIYVFHLSSFLDDDSFFGLFTCVTFATFFFSLLFLILTDHFTVFMVPKRTEERTVPNGKFNYSFFSHVFQSFAEQRNTTQKRCRKLVFKSILISFTSFELNMKIVKYRQNNVVLAVFIPRWYLILPGCFFFFNVTIFFCSVWLGKREKMSTNCRKRMRLRSHLFKFIAYLPSDVLSLEMLLLDQSKNKQKIYLHLEESTRWKKYCSFFVQFFKWPRTNICIYDKKLWKKWIRNQKLLQKKSGEVTLWFF